MSEYLHEHPLGRYAIGACRETGVVKYPRGRNGKIGWRKNRRGPENWRELFGRKSRKTVV